MDNKARGEVGGMMKINSLLELIIMEIGFNADAVVDSCNELYSFWKEPRYFFLIIPFNFNFTQLLSDFKLFISSVCNLADFCRIAYYISPLLVPSDIL